MNLDNFIVALLNIMVAAGLVILVAEFFQIVPIIFR